MPKRNNAGADRGLEKVFAPSEESEFRRQESDYVAVGPFDPTGSGGVLQALTDMAAADNRWHPSGTGEAVPRRASLQRKTLAKAAPWCGGRNLLL